MKKYILYGIGAIVGVLGIVALFVILVQQAHLTAQAKDRHYRAFEAATASLIRSDMKLLYARTYTAGCFDDDRDIAPTVAHCSFTIMQFYDFGTSFRDPTQTTLRSLQSQGYAFYSHTDELAFLQGTATSVHDTLDNSTPIISRLVNRQKDIGVIVSVGDKQRLNLQGPTGLPPSIAKTIPGTKLLGVMRFSQAYPLQPVRF